VGAPAGLAHEAGGVGVVHHDQGVVLVGQVADLLQPDDVAVHGEGAVGGDHLEAATFLIGFLEAALQPLGRLAGGRVQFLDVAHVGVLVGPPLGLAEAHAVDDGGVVQRVADDGVPLAEQRLEHGAVGVEAGGEQDGVVHAQELRHLPLQGLVDVLGAADEPDRRQAVAAVVDPLVGGPDQLGVGGEPEIVVGAEVEALLPLDDDLGALGALDDPLVLVEFLLFELTEFIGQEVFELSIHMPTP